MKLSKKEKTIVNNIVKRFIVNNETFNCCSRHISLQPLFEINSEFFEYNLFDNLRTIIFEEMNPTHIWQNEWSDDFENCVKNDPNFILCVKKYNVKRKLNEIKKDFE